MALARNLGNLWTTTSYSPLTQGVFRADCEKAAGPGQWLAGVDRHRENIFNPEEEVEKKLKNLGFDHIEYLDKIHILAKKNNV